MVAKLIVHLIFIIISGTILLANTYYIRKNSEDAQSLSIFGMILNIISIVLLIIGVIKFISTLSENNFALMYELSAQITIGIAICTISFILFCLYKTIKKNNKTTQKG